MSRFFVLFLLAGLSGADFTHLDTSLIEEPGIEGRWETMFSESSGRRMPWFKDQGLVWEFSKDNHALLISQNGRLLHKGRYSCSGGPGTVDYCTDKGDRMRLGIFKVTGNELLLCDDYGTRSGRPTGFATIGFPSRSLAIFRRAPGNQK